MLSNATTWNAFFSKRRALERAWNLHLAPRVEQGVKQLKDQKATPISATSTDWIPNIYIYTYIYDIYIYICELFNFEIHLLGVRNCKTWPPWWIQFVKVGKDYAINKYANSWTNAPLCPQTSREKFPPKFRPNMFENRASLGTYWWIHLRNCFLLIKTY